MRDFRTWIEIDKNALRHNAEQFLTLIPKKTRLMAVVKSNAYGHGLVLVAQLLANSKLKTLNSKRLWFGVDSIVEALRLRREGIKNPILVLGFTLPARMREAAENDIAITVSNQESLLSISKLKIRPDFHVKIDTGMHRQGFLPREIFKLIKFFKRLKLSPQGVYTHFASKDWGYPSYTEKQFSEFQKILGHLERAGFRNLSRHAAASDATILFPKTHLDMVRIGMGLYGYWPSWVASSKHPSRMRLKPAFAWKTVVGEIKEISAGSYIGYDLTERVARKTKIAVLPVGYWHGYDRGFSNIGEVLIRGRRAKVLGRVSMDMITVDITDINGKSKIQNPKSKVKVGDEAVLIGRQGKEFLGADDVALKVGTTQYELLTRINPLIKRILI